MNLLNPKMAVAVDLVVFTVAARSLQVLLTQRQEEPFKNLRALPASIIHLSETLDEAARRILRMIAKSENVYLEQLYSFSHPRRDPRGRVVTVAYFALVKAEKVALIPQSSAIWYPIDALEKLAFDHQEIIQYALERLRNKLEYTTAAFQLLSQRFTLSELQGIYEIVLGKKIDKRNFRKKLKALNILKDCGMVKREGNHRPARLYTFSEFRFIKLRDRGILFPF